MRETATLLRRLSSLVLDSRLSAVFPALLAALLALRASGIADDVGLRPWFKVALAGFALNQGFAAAAGFAGAWRSAREPAPEALNASVQAQALSGPGREKGWRGIELEAPGGRDEFRKLGQEWARGRWGRVQAAREGESEFQLVAHAGRAAGLCFVAARVLAAAAAACLLFVPEQAFRARMLIEEGRRTDHAEPLMGPAPAAWTPYELEGKKMPGLLRTDFLLEGARLDADATRPRVGMKLLDPRGGLLATLDALPARPARFQGWSFHPISVGAASSHSVDLTLVERGSGAERRFPKLERGQEISLEDYRFKVLDVQPETDQSRPAVEIEYQEGARPAERFWVFEEHRNYDFAHRKESRQNFVLNAAVQRRAAELVVARHPGTGAVGSLLAGALALALCGIARPHRRWWLVWRPGKATLLGWSDQGIRFGGIFDRASDSLRRRLKQKPAGGNRARG